MRTRIVPYTPFGAKLSPLPDALETRLVTPLGDLPTANVQYPRSGVNSVVLDNITELAVEYWGPAGWVEPPNARFLSLRGSFDHLEEVPTRRYDFVGLVGWMLRQAKVWEANGLPVDDDGKVQFNSANAGTILSTLIQNAKGRGWGAGISIDFSATADSAGNAWSKVLTIAYDLNLDLDAVLSNLYQQGVCDYRYEGRTLRIFNPDTVMGRDLTTGTSPLRLVVNDGQTSAPEDWTNEDLLTDALVLGDEGKVWKFTNGASTPLGRLERVITQGGVTDPGTASLLADRELLQGSQTRISYTREFVVTEESTKWPFRDYLPGDWLLAQRGVTFEKLRAYSLSITINSDGVRGHAVLGDRLDDLLTKLAKRTRGITGGASAGGTGARPAPEGPDVRTPAVPTGLVVGVSAYIDDNGLPQGMVDVDWAHNGQATNGTAMTVDRYQLYYRVNQTGKPWKQLIATQETEAAYSPLPIFKADGTTPESYGFKVRAVGNNGVVSEFTAVTAVTMADDTTAPPVPEFRAQDLSTWLRTVKVMTSGKGVDGTTMPRDFSHFNVYQASSSTAAGVLVDSRYGTEPGMAYQSGTMPLAQVWFYLTAVDRSGNESGPSVRQSVTPVANVNVEEIIAVIDAAKITLKNVGEEALKDQAVTGVKLADNAVAQGKLAQAVQDALAQGTSAYGSISGINSSLTNLQTSVTGKTTIINATTDPTADYTGRVDGDRWQKWDTLGPGGKLLKAWRFTGVVWRQELMDPTYLPLVDIGQGTFGSLNGSRLEAGSVKTSALAVTDLLDFAPNFAESPDDWTLTGGMAIVPSAVDPSGRRLGATDNTGKTAWAYGPFRSVRPGDVLYATATLYRGEGATQPALLRYYWADKDKAPLPAGTSTFVSIRADLTNGPNGTVFSGSVTVPAGAVYARLVPIFTAGTGDVGWYNVMGIKQSTSVMIAKGAVTANEVNAQSVAGAVGSFINLNVSQLTASTAGMGQAVIDKLWNDVMNSRKINTEMLYVSGENLVADPLLIDADLNAQRLALSGSPWVVLDDTSSAANMARLPAASGAGVFTFRYHPFSTDPDLDTRIPVVPGQVITAGADFRFRGTPVAGQSSYCELVTHFDTPAKAFLSSSAGTRYTDPGVGATWKRAESKWTVPEGAGYARLVLNVSNPGYTGEFETRLPKVRMGVGADVVIKGAILAEHLTVTEEMWAKVIKFKLLTGGEIDVNALIADSSWIGTMRGGILITDAVDTGALKADAITSKHTITGATFQTTATPSRGITTTSAWQRAWDASGNLTYELNATNGSLLATGTFRTARTGNRVEIYDDAAGGDLRFYSGTNRGSLKAGTSSLAMVYGVPGAVDVPFVSASATQAVLGYRSQLISVGGTTAADQYMKFETGGGRAEFTGPILMRSGQRHQFTYGASVLYAYVGQRPESGSTPDFEIKALEGGIRFGGQLQSLSTYDTTTTSAANVFVASDGKIYRSSSASRYKLDQREAELTGDPLAVHLKDWIDKAAVERLAEFEGEDPSMTETRALEYETAQQAASQRVTGLIAEDLLAAGQDRFVIFGPDGQTEGVMYDRFAFAQIAALNAKLEAALGLLKQLQQGE